MLGRRKLEWRVYQVLTEFCRYLKPFWYNIGSWRTNRRTDRHLATSKTHYVKKLKPDKLLMGKPSQNYGVPPKYGAHNKFNCSPT